MIAFWLWFVSVAAAQGLAGFLSPGPLAEPHAGIDTVTGCPKCHDVGSGVSATKCMACHDEVAAQVSEQRGFHADKGQKCQSCHPDHLGRGHALVKLAESTFDHDTTGFPLEGAHLRAECTDCHTTPGKWTGLTTACRSCHDEPHGASESTRRTLFECGSCHTVKDWKVGEIAAAVFDHRDAQQVDWVLEGAHREVECEECHADARFVPTAHEACTSCHDDPHRAPFSDDCTTCHAQTSWRVANFDHTRTGWPLEGQHTEVSCATCHRGGVTRRLAHETCADCHADIHGGQFAPRPCDTCHTVTQADFRILGFDHERTAFPLRGRHGTVACADCHGAGRDGRYADLPHADCDACHQDPHAAKFEPTDCRSCHTEDGWGVGEFDHGRTDFPLKGAHATVQCEECHPNQQMTGIAHDSCRDCHADETPHEDPFEPGRCDECHDEAAWATVTFDHGTTPFALAPQHVGQACDTCHDVKRFAGLDATCRTCHDEDRPSGHYAGACGDCHAAADWVPADLGDVDHAVTGFPLDGVHSLEPCASCHPPGAPRGDVVGTCLACHSDDDVHRHALGDSCGDCHVPTTWMQSRFRHFQTGWSLRGAHRLVACDTCHANGYVATPSDCRSCHGGEADPTIAAHRSVFAADCERCHQPFTWAAPGYGHGR